jgi:hypothetical protein
MAVSDLISRNRPDRLSYFGFEDRDAIQGIFIWNALEIFFRFLSREIEVPVPSRKCMHADAKISCDKNKTKQYQGTFLRFPYQTIGHEPEN